MSVVMQRSREDTGPNGVMQPRAKEHRRVPATTAATKRLAKIMRRAFGGITCTLDLNFWAPEVGENTFCWFKPPSLWWLVVAVPENSCNTVVIDPQLKLWVDTVITSLDHRLQT